MPALTWSPELVLHNAAMDTTHEEFVALLAMTESALAAADEVLLCAFDTLVEHTIDHFAQEDRWMAATGFAPENCHSFQHQAVLQVMKECARRAREGHDFEPLRLAVSELAIWFPQHARMMDAALAQHLASVGFDAATGQRREPVLAGEASSGCGGSSCG